MAKKKKKLEDFFREKSEAKASDFEQEKAPDNYVIDPKREAEYKAKKKEANAEALKQSYEDSENSGAINLVGAVVDRPKPEVVDSERTPAKPSIKDLIPKDEEEAAPALEPEVVGPKEAAPAPEKEDDSSFPWDRALVGATPLLVGLLSGNELEGVQTASDHLIKDEGDLVKRERDLAGKLEELKRKQELGPEQGTRRYRPQTIALEDGTSIKATFDAFTGKYQYPDGSEIPSRIIRAGYAVNPEEYDRRKMVSSSFKRADADYLGQNVKVNPETGELEAIRNMEAIPLKNRRERPLNVKQEKDIENAVKSFRSSPAYKNNIPVLQTSAKAEAFLDAADRANDPNAIAGTGVVLQVARSIQGSGVITDRDAASLGGAQALDTILTRITDKITEGRPITHRDVADLREIVDIGKKAAKRELGIHLAQQADLVSERYGIDKAIVVNQLGGEVSPFMEEAPIRSEIAPKVINWRGQKKEAPNRTYSLPVEVNENLEWIDPARWEEARDAGARRLD